MIVLHYFERPRGVAVQQLVVDLPGGVAVRERVRQHALDGGALSQFLKTSHRYPHRGPTPRRGTR